jgi:hypothetical protein
MGSLPVLEEEVEESGLFGIQLPASLVSGPWCSVSTIQAAGSFASIHPLPVPIKLYKRLQSIVSDVVKQFSASYSEQLFQ